MNKGPGQEDVSEVTNTNEHRSKELSRPKSKVTQGNTAKSIKK